MCYAEFILLKSKLNAGLDHVEGTWKSLQNFLSVSLAVAFLKPLVRSGTCKSFKVARWGSWYYGYFSYYLHLHTTIYLLTFWQLPCHNNMGCQRKDAHILIFAIFLAVKSCCSASDLREMFSSLWLSAILKAATSLFTNKF